jgi:hypothetical protein
MRKRRSLSGVFLSDFRHRWNAPFLVIPANAGIDFPGKANQRGCLGIARTWIPACAGMTGLGLEAFLERFRSGESNARHSGGRRNPFSGEGEPARMPGHRADMDSSLRWNDGACA